MTKTKTKSRKLAKGVALGFAAMLTATSMPVGAVIALAEDYKGTSSVTSNTNRIAIGEDDKTAKAYVTKGETVTIPKGIYYGKSSSEHVIGGEKSGTITTSTVIVTYSNGTEVATDGNSFVANWEGTYTIKYAVVDDGILYTYEFQVICEANEAEFEFALNDSNIIPSVYDVAIADGKDIVLPLPSVNDEDGKEILSSDSDNFTTDKTSIPVGKNAFVQVSITNGSEYLQIVEDEGKFVVKTKDYDKTDKENKPGHITSQQANKEYTINYSYYEVIDGAKVFVASTTKKFKVQDGYYKQTKDGENGYSILATRSSKIDSAVVGVAKSLPTISATTNTGNYPASESIEIYYTLKVFTKGESGAFDKDVTADVINEDNKFIANAEGSYRFKYEVCDFYGNKVVEDPQLDFTIENVKDTKSPEVFMYDAGSHTTEEVTNKEFRSAEAVAKNKTGNRNIIMYAIGGKDNLSTNTVTLRREIWKANTNIVRITEQAYNNYNLIFAPSAGSGTDVYTQIVSDNYEIEKQMILDDKNPSDKESIKTWLANNNYLLVTTTNKDIDNNDIVADFDESNVTDEVIGQFIDKGYAYIVPEKGETLSFTSADYRYEYYANDNNGNSEGNYSFKFETEDLFKDNSAPTITFPTTLQNSYLPTDTITFSAITNSNVSDNKVDSNVVVGTAYRYLKTKTLEPAEAEGTEGTKTLSYVIKGETNEEHKNKYYYTSKNEKGLFSQGGWHYDEDATSYKINLGKERPEDANYIEILAYAIDDDGNIGFYNKIITIASADKEVMELVNVLNVETDKTYTAGETITLPTLQFTDDNVGGMRAKVDVYKVTGSGDETVKERYTSSSMKTSFDKQAGIFTVDAGKFITSSGGSYQVVVTVTDSANHAQSIFFKYSVNDNVTKPVIEISGINASSETIKVGEAYYLPTPQIQVGSSIGYAYIGLGDEDDSSNATYYFPQIVSDNATDCELDEHYFYGTTAGTFKIRYEIFLLRYSTASEDFADTLTAERLSLENGTLVYMKGGTKYYVKADPVTGELRANTESSLQGTELSAEKMSLLATKVKVFSTLSSDPEYKLNSAEITIKVNPSITVNIPNDAYATTDYPDITDVPEVEIVKPTIDVKGEYQTDLENSTVTITYSSNASSSRQIASIKLSDWEKAVSSSSYFKVEGKKISLLLSEHGSYKISYSIQAMDKYGATVGDPETRTYTIKSGDTSLPTVKVLSNKVITTEYNVGDSMSLEFEGTSLDELGIFENLTDGSDAGSATLNDLLNSLKVTIKGPNGTETLDNDAENETGKDITKFKFNYTFDTAGDYTLTFKVTDNAGNYSTDTVSISVKAKEAKTTDVKQVMGGVLIGVSVALLAGVVIYFVVSKVKLDKKERSYKKK